MSAWVVYGLATWPCPKVQGRRYVCSSHHWPLRWPSTNDERDGPPADTLWFRAFHLPTYIHTYIHTHIHTYIHTYTRTYIITYIHTHRHTDRQTDIHTYIQTDRHTYIPPMTNIPNTPPPQATGGRRGTIRSKTGHPSLTSQTPHHHRAGNHKKQDWTPIPLAGRGGWPTLNHICKARRYLLFIGAKIPMIVLALVAGKSQRHPSAGSSTGVCSSDLWDMYWDMTIKGWDADSAIWLFAHKTWINKTRRRRNGHVISILTTGSGGIWELPGCERIHMQSMLIGE